MSSKYCVSTFYKFTAIDPKDIESLEDRIISEGNLIGIRGLILIGPEGCNATIAASQESIDRFKDFIQNQKEIGKLVFKDSYSEFMPFRRLKVDLRREIVNINNPNTLPDKDRNNHLTPEEWNKLIESEEDLLIVDTRNFYETDIGLFEGAADLRLTKFSEFPDKFDQLGVSKEKKVLMYCTGGIRCEKAIIELQKRGYNECYQLDGGILKYLEEFPNSHFRGECFVFDHRVAVDQNLNPSTKYSSCPHCGNPAEHTIVCENCSTEAKICSYCQNIPGRISCSKNCAHHVRRAIMKSDSKLGIIPDYSA